MAKQIDDIISLDPAESFEFSGSEVTGNIYERLIAWTQERLATIADAFDRWIIAGLLVRGTHGTIEFVGRALRLVQTGNLQTYAFLFVVGVVFVLVLVLVK